ncbi:hypothetical protein GCM10020331_091580 [Ectobacillus funiculus]
MMQAGTGRGSGWDGTGQIADRDRRTNPRACREAARRVEIEDEDEDDNIDIDPTTGEPVDCGGSWNIVWDLQSTHGHGSRGSTMPYISAFPGKAATGNDCNVSREISKLWHQFF